MPRGEIHLQLAVDFADHPDIRKLTRFGRDARAVRDLFVQMLCYCKRNLSDGFVPAEQLGILVFPDPVKVGERDVARLVDVELVQIVDGGYWLPSYLKRNKSRAEVEKLSDARAETGRAGGKRSGLVRSAQAKPNQVASTMSNTETESYTETKTSAAADGQLDEYDLPDELVILRSKMLAHTALSKLRWDKLTPETAETIRVLIEIHGDKPLIDRALKTTRADETPVFVQFYLQTWCAMPAPGQILAAVVTRCPDPDHIGFNLPCSACAADSKAAAS